MRISSLLPALALLSSGCIVEAPSGGQKPPPEVERARAMTRDLPAMTVKLSANLEDKVEVVNAILQPGQVAPGEPAKVTVFFKTLEEMSADYMIFVHVEDVDNRVERMNLDHKPAGGQYPTNQWKKGEIIKDEFVVYVPPLPIRALNVWMGFWEPKTDTRLRLRNVDQVRNDGRDRLMIMQIPVVR
ncbi:MAG TPA: hypothetical protein VK447_03915 [Myxococcaceae bacterium]|nr:hypothetical protein [Myxococcaceae bacterium]